MATDLTITDKQEKHLGPACLSAPRCCWYETSGEREADCTNRNALVCKLRREEVFSSSTGSPSRSGIKVLAAANS
ncbi:MAG: hypothetical protein LBW85_02065 [Deltaproteobacteria bacterium]|jgi:hypothetical protein|nr:hypothetical protein [Deltaproteobacteria bacterium]